MQCLQTMCSYLRVTLYITFRVFSNLGLSRDEARNFWLVAPKTKIIYPVTYFSQWLKHQPQHYSELSHHIFVKKISQFTLFAAGRRIRTAELPHASSFSVCTGVRVYIVTVPYIVETAAAAGDGDIHELTYKELLQLSSAAAATGLITSRGTGCLIIPFQCSRCVG